MISLRMVLSLLSGFAAAAVLSAAVEMHPAFQRMILTSPSASAASLFLGLPCVEDGQDFFLAGRAGYLRVSSFCSGSSFFSMISGLFIFAVCCRTFSIRNVILSSATVPFLWIVTVVVNGMRIAASFHVALLFSSGSLVRFGAGAHLWTGIIFFLPALIIFYILFQRSGLYE